MICQRCHRQMQEPAAVVHTRSGRAGFGPKCAKAMGILPSRVSVRVKRQADPRDPRQIDWVREAGA